MIWVIGGSEMQVPMILEVLRRGYECLVTDRDANCAARAIPGVCFHWIDTSNTSAHLALAMEIGDQIEAVVNPATDTGPLVALLSRTLGKPGCDPAAAHKTKNKVEFRIAAHQAGLKHPEYLVADLGRVGDTWKSWEKHAKGFGIEPYPAVVKAADSSASRGMTLVTEAAQWGGALEKAKKYTYGELGLVEEYVPGQEYAIDTLVDGDEVQLVNSARRMFRAFGIEAGHVNPGLSDGEVEEVGSIAKRLKEALGVNWGPFKLDLVKSEKYGWCVLEGATRLSGGFDHAHTAVLSRGLNITGAYLDMALGKRLSDPEVQRRVTPQGTRYAAAYAPRYEPGKIKGWRGTEEAWKMAGVVWVFAKNWTEIPKMDDCAARPVFVIASGATENNAWLNAWAGASEIRPIREGE